MLTRARAIDARHYSPDSVQVIADTALAADLARREGDFHHAQKLIDDAVVHARALQPADPLQLAHLLNQRANIVAMHGTLDAANREPRDYDVR